MKTTSFAGYECVRLTNEHLTLWLTTSVGPRIIGLSVLNGDNLLAELPGVTTNTPAGQVYSLRGGHRLWHAPEHPERTYIPDDQPVRLEDVPGGISVAQPVESLTGIEKRITVTLPDHGAQVTIEHTLTNKGSSAIRAAPWAITQLKPGGFAILPQAVADTGLLPNRHLALWPYSDVNSTHLVWGNRFILLQADMADGKLKIGWANPVGWMGYWVEDTLFVKAAVYKPDATYFDFGSSSECYCDPRFLELETLGPAATLAPGEATTHREVWSVFADVPLRPEEESVANWVARLGISSQESSS